MDERDPQPERDLQPERDPHRALDGPPLAPVVVWRGGSDSQCAEMSLVLAAAGIAHERLTGPRFDHLLVVQAADAARAAREIAAYRKERERPAPAQDAPAADFAGAWIGVVGYAALLMLVAICAGQSFLGFDWLVAGVLEAGPALHGEPWRLVTALTLHADAGHLAGNLGFGGFFGYFTSRRFGFGVAWLAILGAAILGNLLNSAIQPEFHRSIGASTAVFAALGLLTAYSWRRGLAQTSWRARIAPIAAGLALLAFTGTGGENTDVLAHLMGFAAGFGLGAVLARWPLPASRLLQAACGAASVLIVLGAWAWALAAAQ